MPDRSCTVPECHNARTIARGLCRKHYSRLYRKGSTEATSGKSLRHDRGLLAWMESQSEVRGNCLVWTGSTLKGYGRFRRNGKNHLVHRAAWIERNGTASR